MKIKVIFTLCLVLFIGIVLIVALLMSCSSKTGLDFRIMCAALAILVLAIALFMVATLNSFKYDLYKIFILEKEQDESNNVQKCKAEYLENELIKSLKETNAIKDKRIRNLEKEIEDLKKEIESSPNNATKQTGNE